MKNPFILLERRHPDVWSVVISILYPVIAAVAFILIICNIIANIFTDVIIQGFKDSWEIIKLNFDDLGNCMKELFNLIKTNWRGKDRENRE